MSWVNRHIPTTFTSKVHLQIFTGHVCNIIYSHNIKVNFLILCWCFSYHHNSSALWGHLQETSEGDPMELALRHWQWILWALWAGDLELHSIFGCLPWIFGTRLDWDLGHLEARSNPCLIVFVMWRGHIIYCAVLLIWVGAHGPQ